MNSEMKIFENPEFGSIRTVEENGKVLFCGTDVAKALGYNGNPQEAIRRHCREDGCVNHAVIDSIGREQQAKFIDEGNLYRLITHSKLPEAEKFESWVFDDVLPTIRRHGMYATDELINNPDIAIAAFTALKEEREKTRQLTETVAVQNQQIAEDRPKVVFADAVTTSKTSILIGDLAKLIKQNGVDIGQKRLFEWMRTNGYLIKSGNSKNMPLQRYMEQGLFEVKESVVANPDGSSRVTRTTKVTGKGQQYFINLFLARERTA